MEMLIQFLVTGTAMTLDFAMLAYSRNNDRRIMVEFHEKNVVSVAASGWGEWHSSGLPHHNCGPWLLIGGDARTRGPNADPSTYNQCVFF